MVSQQDLQEFSAGVANDLPDDDLFGFDIDMIFQIMDKIMEMLDNCPQSRRTRSIAAYRRGLNAGPFRRRWWQRALRNQVQAAAGDICTNVVADTIGQRFAALDEKTVAKI